MGRILKYVTIYGLGNKKKSIKALLDSGADISVISEKIARDLGLNKYPSEIRQYTGINNVIHRGKVVYTGVVIDGKEFGGRFFILKSKGVLIGNDLLQHSSISLDFKNHKAKVRKEDKIKVFRV